MKRPIQKLWLALLCATLLLASLPAHAEAEEDESLWRECKYSTSNRMREGFREIWDTNASSDYIIPGPGDLTVSWKDSTPAATLYLEWKTLPNDFTITQYKQDGSVVETEAGELYELNQLYALSKDTRSIIVSSDTDMDLCTAVVYGPDTIPEDYHPWNATPAKLDYLVVVAHPDDDAIFMGAIVPTYGVERGLSGTILYTCSSNIRYRCNEALNGAWVMGLRNHPIFGNFPDILPSLKKKWEFQFKVKKLTSYYVRMIRQYEPEVIITHDTEGEYGHWQHENVAEAVCEAVKLAADASFDPESAGQYGTFQVKKLYLHLYPDNKIKLDVTSPIKEFQGKNIRAISKLAFQQHASQAKASHYDENNAGVYSLSDFGLYYSCVGPDTAGNDMFENIDPESLSNYSPPTPSPSAVPSNTPLAEALWTPAPAAAAQKPESMLKAEDSLLYLLIFLCGAAFSAAVALVVLFIRKKHRKHIS